MLYIVRAVRYVAQYVAREKLRFELADRDGDQLLTERELAAFLVPDCYNHTVPIIARTLLHRDDYDGDGKLSTYEFQPDSMYCTALQFL